MDTEERGLAENPRMSAADAVRFAAILLRHGHILESAQAAYAAWRAADTMREKVAATHPLQLALADIADELNNTARPRDFDETADYCGQAERKLGDGEIWKWLLRFAEAQHGLLALLGIGK